MLLARQDEGEGERERRRGEEKEERDNERRSSFPQVFLLTPTVVYRVMIEMQTQQSNQVNTTAVVDVNFITK